MERTLVNYEYGMCPKCDYRESYPWENTRKFGRRYDKTKDEVLCLCPQCGFEGDKEEFLHSETRELSPYEVAEKIKTQLNSAVSAARCANVKLHYFELTIGELAIVLRYSPSGCTKRFFRKGIYYDGVPIRAYADTEDDDG